MIIPVDPYVYFNPRPPHGERLLAHLGEQAILNISIHAPRMGSDKAKDETKNQICISIHAPRMGSDCFHSNL